MADFIAQSWSANPDENVQVDPLDEETNIEEFCPAGNVNNAMRAIMSAIKEYIVAVEEGLVEFPGVTMPDASSTVKGKIRVATDEEARTGKTAVNPPGPAAITPETYLRQGTAEQLGMWRAATDKEMAEGGNSLSVPNSKQVAELLANVAKAAIPVGICVVWSGALDKIPDGFRLCDGQSGAPDMKRRVVYGAQVGDVPGTTGGEETHEHKITGSLVGATTLTTSSIASHKHRTSMTIRGIGDLTSGSFRVYVPGDTTSVETDMEGGGQPHTHPPGKDVGTEQASNLQPYVLYAWIQRWDG